MQVASQPEQLGANPQQHAPKKGILRSTPEVQQKIKDYVKARGADGYPVCSVLIANNGLAAVKFIRSIRTWCTKTFGNDRAVTLVAMASGEDIKMNAEHIRLADQFVEVPSGPNLNNYANVKTIVRVAQSTNVDAVWPGWGHASENPSLPRLLAETAGKIRFLGPGGDAMEALGDKVGSTIIAQTAGVPCVRWSGEGVLWDTKTQGYVINDKEYQAACVHSIQQALDVCHKIGYPVMLKASWGGGGKGIRKVASDHDVRMTFQQIQGEVPGSPIFAMQLAPKARHIEVQLVCDMHGGVVSLYTRDCSIQRRHQKMVEEGPAQQPPEDVKLEMERCARNLARAVGYVGAATVEYLYTVDDNKAFFLELNPRLQVEHPVTEWITDVNIPACQLHIAMGLPLTTYPDIRKLYGKDPAGVEPFDLETTPKLPPDQHVVAVRITSEDAGQGFKPTSGQIETLNFNGVPQVWGYFSAASGGGIHEYSDSQFGHIFAKGATRNDALKNMCTALHGITVHGTIRTNVDYAIDMVQCGPVVQDTVHTGWLDQRIAEQVRAKEPPWELSVIAGAVVKASVHLTRKQMEYKQQIEKGQPSEPEGSLVQFEDQLVLGSRKFNVRVSMAGPEQFTVSLGGRAIDVVGRKLKSGGYMLQVDGGSHVVYADMEAMGMRLTIDSSTCLITNDHDPSLLRTPSTGKLIQYLVPDGSHVKQNEHYASIEVMKMVMMLSAPAAGVVTQFQFTPGAQLEAGAIVARLDLDDPSQVARAVLFDGDLPEMRPPKVPPTQPDLQLKETMERALLLLDGYNQDASSVVQSLVTCLNDPSLPWLTWTSVYDTVEQHLDESIVQDIQVVLSNAQSHVSQKSMQHVASMTSLRSLGNPDLRNKQATTEGNITSQDTEGSFSLQPHAQPMQPQFDGPPPMPASDDQPDMLSAFAKLSRDAAASPAAPAPPADPATISVAPAVSLSDGLAANDSIGIRGQRGNFWPEFPSKKLLEVLRGHITTEELRMPLMDASNNESQGQLGVLLQPLVELLQAYRQGSSVYNATLVARLFDRFLTVEEAFQARGERTDQEALQELRHRYKNDSDTVFAFAMSHCEVALKARFVLRLIEQFVRSEPSLYKEQLRRLAAMEGHAMGDVAANASALLQQQQVTDLRNVIFSAVSNPDLPTLDDLRGKLLMYSGDPTKAARGGTGPGRVNVGSGFGLQYIPFVQFEPHSPLMQRPSWRRVMGVGGGDGSQAGGSVRGKMSGVGLGVAAVDSGVTTDSFVGVDSSAWKQVVNDKSSMYLGDILKVMITSTAPLDDAILGAVMNSRNNVQVLQRCVYSYITRIYGHYNLDAVELDVKDSALFASWSFVNPLFLGWGMEVLKANGATLCGMLLTCGTMDDVEGNLTKLVEDKKDGGQANYLHIILTAPIEIAIMASIDSEASKQLTKFSEASFSQASLSELDLGITSKTGLPNLRTIVSQAESTLTKCSTLFQTLNVSRVAIIFDYGLAQPASIGFNVSLSPENPTAKPGTIALTHIPALSYVDLPRFDALELARFGQGSAHGPGTNRAIHVVNMYEKPDRWSNDLQRMFLRADLGSMSNSGALYTGDKLGSLVEVTMQRCLEEVNKSCAVVGFSGGSMVQRASRPDWVHMLLVCVQPLKIAGPGGDEEAVDESIVRRVLRDVLGRVSDQIKGGMSRAGVFGWELKVRVVGFEGYWRIVGDRPSGYEAGSDQIAVYREAIDTNNTKQVPHTIMYQAITDTPATPTSTSTSITHKLNHTHTLTTIPTLPRLSQKQLAARRHRTTYAYDYPAIFEQACREVWQQLVKASRTGTMSGAQSPQIGASSTGGALSPTQAITMPRGRLVDAQELILDDEMPAPKTRPPLHYQPYRSALTLKPTNRDHGLNVCGMVVWRLTCRTPEAPDGRDVIVVVNDITHSRGSFGPWEDAVFKAAVELSLAERLPIVYIAANSGARMGLAVDVQKLFRVKWVDDNEPRKGFQYLYLSKSDYEGLSDKGQVVVEQTMVDGEEIYKLMGIVGLEDGIGVECLSGSGAIAGLFAKAFREGWTATLVSGQTVGIGAYLARLGRRVVQRLDQPIILTGYKALNKLLGRPLYTSHLQLGGPRVMSANGVTHHLVPDDSAGVRTLIHWLSYVPIRLSQLPPQYPAVDLPSREVAYGFGDDGEILQQLDPRKVITGESHSTRESKAGGEGKGAVDSVHSAPSPVSYPWKGGLFDKGSWVEFWSGWAKTVITGRARLGGMPVGVIAVETSTQTTSIPADPGQPDSSERDIQQAGQVWFPDSAKKTADAMEEFSREKLPLFILANWRGFSGGQRDLFDGVLQAGSLIVESLRTYSQPVFVYLQPGSELRGGAWVVVDSQINPDYIEMYADLTARGGILEPDGMVEIKFKSDQIARTMQRLQPNVDSDSKKALRPLYTQVAHSFAELHDVPHRMKAKGVVKDIVPWKHSREFFATRLALRMGQLSALLYAGVDVSAGSSAFKAFQKAVEDRFEQGAEGVSESIARDREILEWLTSNQGGAFVKEWVSQLYSSKMESGINGAALGSLLQARASADPAFKAKLDALLSST